jgi:hypothetical protein
MTKHSDPISDPIRVLILIQDSNGVLTGTRLSQNFIEGWFAERWFAERWFAERWFAEGWFAEGWRGPGFRIGEVWRVS